MSIGSRLKGAAAQALLVLLAAAVAAAWWQHREARREHDARVAAELAREAAEQRAELAIAEAERQSALLDDLRVAVAAAEAEKERYMRVFADHDLERLVRAKPGLMERRINDGTAEVYQRLGP